MIRLNKSKYLLTLPAAMLVAGGWLLAPTPAQAFAGSGDVTTLIQRIADKFGLNQSDVQAVFDQVRTERQTQMQQTFTERLDQAVADGKLSEEAKQLIEAKHQEMMEQRESDRANWQSMTAEQRRAAAQTRREELQNWAEEHGIDLSWLGGGARGNHKMGMWH